MLTSNAEIRHCGDAGRTTAWEAKVRGADPQAGPGAGASGCHMRTMSRAVQPAPHERTLESGAFRTHGQWFCFPFFHVD